MRTLFRLAASGALALAMAFAAPSAGFAHDGSHDPAAPAAAAPADAGAPARVKVKLHDIELIDQDGRARRFASEVVGEDIVVMGFVYTTCQTICPVLSQVMAQMQDDMEGGLSGRVKLVSISIDPATDTPARLKEYAETVGAGPDWTWLTGSTADVTKVLTGLGAYTPDFVNHPGMILVGDPKADRWFRFFGFPNPDDVVAEVRNLAERRQALREDTGQAAPAPPQPHAGVIRASTGGPADSALDAKARAYFTDLTVVDHDGRERRFYTDLLQDKVVLVSLFYSTCSGACPIINGKLANLQDLLGEALGEEIFLVSLTIDPEHDTQPVIAKYAEMFQARPGWSFVTGDPANIETIVRKLGYLGDDPAEHPLYFMAGDVKRAHWKKFTPDAPEALLAVYLRDLVDEQS
jgi:cytochrome oxidase Cu insertion factor (SCO1/SenC/PrrC family)